LEETIARLFQIFLALAGAYLLALWFALAVWTYRDITSRSTNPIVQIFSTLIVVLFFAPGAIIYLILRPRETLDEAFQRSMEEEYLVQDLEEFPLCPSCRRAVREDFVFCPNCHVELRHACASCRRLIDLRWDLCPYCGADQYAAAPVLTELTRDEPAQPMRVRASNVHTLGVGDRVSHDGAQKRQHWEHDEEFAVSAPSVSGAWTSAPDDGADIPDALPSDGRAARGVSAAGGVDPDSAQRPAGSGS
jgi:RNA polymerase subunit RPABC4/transcription elongation factor Spt4